MKLAINGAAPTITTPRPHFRWPPELPELAGVVADYISSGRPLSIIDRSGIYGQLEDRLAELMGRRYAILMSSGTMALYSAFFGLDLGVGDEVVSTIYSFHATATPLLHLGVRVVFCDVEADTGNIDVGELEARITDRTRAVVTNHMWGHPVDADRILDLCKRRGIVWVEDCSHAHFAEYRGRRVGSLGDVSVMSLQGNKLLTGGEGGVLLTDSTEVHDRATLLGHGLKRSKDCVEDERWRDILRTGFGLKLRMHPLAAVIVDHLLEHHCFEWIESRRRVLATFTRLLEDAGPYRGMARRDYCTSMGAHYGFKPRVDLVSLGISRERLVEALRAEGMDVSIPASPPFHQLAIFDPERFPINRFEKVGTQGRSFPGVERYRSDILSLPTFTFEADLPLVEAYAEAFAKVAEHVEELR